MSLFPFCLLCSRSCRNVGLTSSLRSQAAAYRCFVCLSSRGCRQVALTSSLVRASLFALVLEGRADFFFASVKPAPQLQNYGQNLLQSDSDWRGFVRSFVRPTKTQHDAKPCDAMPNPSYYMGAYRLDARTDGWDGRSVGRSIDRSVGRSVVSVGRSTDGRTDGKYPSTSASKFQLK